MLFLKSVFLFQYGDKIPTLAHHDSEQSTENINMTGQDENVDEQCSDDLLDGRAKRYSILIARHYFARLTDCLDS